MSDEVKKGLMGIVVDETTISQVMPEINSLTYRGYKVQDLCEKCIFEEVAYLVLNGELPRSKELKKFINEERNNRKLSKQILNDIKNMPKKWSSWTAWSRILQRVTESAKSWPATRGQTTTSP
mgnify:CR=1 FL=1